jgi:hypothetical protein
MMGSTDSCGAAIGQFIQGKWFITGTVAGILGES